MKIMLGCNQNITVWCRKKVPQGNKEIFIRRVLPVKCRWKNCAERNAGNGTANIYNNVVIIIPYFENETGFDIFDIKEGDIAALGVYGINITGTSPYTASEIKRLLAPNIATINSVSHNFDSGSSMSSMSSMKGKHLRLTGN